MWYLVIILVLMIIYVRYNVDYYGVNGYDIWICYRYRVIVDMILVMLDVNVY